MKDVLEDYECFAISICTNGKRSVYRNDQGGHCLYFKEHHARIIANGLPRKLRAKVVNAMVLVLSK